MTPAPTCPQCGARVPAGTPDSLCPACLMSGALPSPSDPGATMIVEKPKPRVMPHPGEIYGGYRIEHELGRGGMGAVYAAEHLESGRRVALKVLSQQLDSPDARARFLREGRLAASINHPNSVYVFGTEEIDDTPVIAMELIAGGTLQDRIQRSGPLPVGAAVDAVLQIIAGLEAAHSVGILHRDIKPANCFEDTDGTVKIGDFGLSISTGGRDESMHTLDGTFLGTPAFCSPEQLRGQELNVHSDMYAVGVTLFYLLTGRTPFDGKNMVQLLANSLEKPAPSPVQYRADIPQGLARIVLRCLNKQATERFGTYHELRQALQAFASIAPTPATLGLRFAAGMIDHIILAALSLAFPLLFLDSPMELLNPENFHTWRFLWLMLGTLAVRHLYFGILEGVWGASAGKALMGLRVARLNRSAPGIPRALLRSVLLQAFVFAELFRYNSVDVTKVTTASYLWLAAQVLFFLALFMTARRRNGFAALHDLWTQTRVIQKSAYQPRSAMAQTGNVVTTTADMPKVGPYHILSTLSDTGGQMVLLGYDTRLLRKGWIRRTLAGAPPVPPAQRNIARPGRLRWLQGERQEHEAWDVYEAAGGIALTSLITRRQPWRAVRHWLNDLNAELDAATRTGSLPDRLALDRVWITAEGRAKLLDFTAPGSAELSSGGEDPITAQAFLHQVALSALEGRCVPAQEAAHRGIAVPLPLKARETLQKLAGGADLHATALQLQTLTQQPTEVSYWRRFALVFGTVLPSLLLTICMAVGMTYYRAWSLKNPAYSELFGCVMSYHQMLRGVNPPELKGLPLNDSRIAMEIHIAGTYGPLVRDPSQWKSSIGMAMLPPTARATVERLVQERPHPAAEEVSRAKALLKPLLDTRVAERAKWMGLSGREHMLDFICASVMVVYLCLTALLSLFCAVAFRGGLMMRILGIAVVRNDGETPSRLHLFWRSLIAWSPILLTPVLLILLAPVLTSKSGDQGLMNLLTLLSCVTLIPGVITLAMRGRGLQDRLARTWLVPR